MLRMINVVGHDGTVHQGIFGPDVNDLHLLTCGASRYLIVHPYNRVTSDHTTEEPVDCPGCFEITVAGDPDERPIAVARRYADQIMADADQRGFVPAMDNEGIRLAAERCGIDELRYIDDSTPPLYPLIREHLSTGLTERATTPDPGTSLITLPYTPYTGGRVMAPVAPGDRIQRDGIKDGIWTQYTVVEITPDGAEMTLREDSGFVRTCSTHRASQRFFKRDRPAARSLEGAA